MIKYIKGDLLASDCDVIAHGCNCFNSMGSGIARQVMMQMKPAFMVDQLTERGSRDKLGTFTKAQCGDKLVYNLYSQYNFTRTEVDLDYDALENALVAMRDDISDPDLKIGFPKIGCGLASGDWNVVAPMIEQVFGNKDVFVYVYEG